MRNVTVCLCLFWLASCTPAEYKRDVTARVDGPSLLHVGEKVFLTVRLEYSDGRVFPTAPSTYDASANAVVDWVSSDPMRATVGEHTGLVIALAAGQVTITATPSVTTTEGRRTSDAIRIDITD